MERRVTSGGRLRADMGAHNASRWAHQEGGNIAFHDGSVHWFANDLSAHWPHKTHTPLFDGIDKMIRKHFDQGGKCGYFGCP